MHLLQSTMKIREKKFFLMRAISLTSMMLMKKNFQMRMMEALTEKKVPMLMIQYTYLLVMQVNYMLLHAVQRILHWLQLAVLTIKDFYGKSIRRLDFCIRRSKYSVSSLAFSVDGQLLASGGLDGVVKIWDTARGDLKCTLEGPTGNIEWVRWHPKGHLVLAGSDDSSVWMWNADKAAYLNVFTGHGSSVTCGDFTPDGKIICSGSDDATMRIWNPRTGEIIHVIRGHPYHIEGLTCLTINSDSSLVLTGSTDGSVHIINISTGKVVSSLSGHSESIECAAFEVSSRGTYSMAATGGMDNKLVIWDLQHSSPRCTCDHEDGVTCLLWLAGSRYIATGSVDGKVRIWDGLSGDCAKVFCGHAGPIQSIASSSNGEFLVSVSIDGTARVFEIAEF